MLIDGSGYGLNPLGLLRAVVILRFGLKRLGYRVWFPLKIPNLVRVWSPRCSAKRPRRNFVPTGGESDNNFGTLG